MIHAARSPDEFDVLEDEIEAKSGVSVKYVYVHSPYEVVFVVGIDVDERVIMLRQDRYLAGQELLEVPAGSPEDAETLEDAARREFEEEAGYSIAHLERIASFYSSIGLTDQVNHIYVGWGLAESKQRLEEGEVISVEPIPLAHVVDLALEGQVWNVGTAYSLILAERWWNRKLRTQQLSGY